MVNGTITRRYAEGLLLATKANGSMDQVAKEMELLISTLMAHSDLLSALEHPLLPEKAKINILSGIFGETLSTQVYHLCSLLFSRKRSAYLIAIAQRFLLLAQEERNEMTVVIETAQPISSDELVSWQDKLGKIAGKKVIPVVKINQELIAGYRIRLGDRVLEASLSGALRQFEQKLKVAGAF